MNAALEGRLPRSIGVEKLRDLPLEWGRQFETLGLNSDWYQLRPSKEAQTAPGCRRATGMDST
jgi:hypothetical protein